MLVITDFGCDVHLLRRLKYNGPEAQVMREVIANLPVDGYSHTYICEHGHSHRLMLELQMPEGVIGGIRELNIPLKPTKS
ncbi:MAG: hypothetical protein M1438_05915 [Deltaproteobacteria bacterium]|nr:hypothetical protein [Deltaproteobacteria bacterium]